MAVSPRGMPRKGSFMKKSLILFLAVLLVTGCLYIAVYATGSYDSTVDPVVTLSYVNNNLLPQITGQIEELRNLITTGGTGTGGSGISSTQFTELAIRVTELESAVAKLGNGGGGGAASGSVYAVVYVPAGKTLICTNNSLEFILRAGEAKIVSPFTTPGSEQGIADMTSGADLLNNQAVSLNHQMLIPRANDGRGIVITSNGAYVMVRGEYAIVD